MEGFIFDIQPFSLHDGPGTRTTVFMQGCPLSCKWCHNPESQPFSGAILHYPARCISCGSCMEACKNGLPGKTALHTDACTLCGECALTCYADAIKKSGKAILEDELYAACILDKDVYASSGGGVTFSGGEPLMQADFLLKVMKRLKADGIHIAIETSLSAKWETIEKLLPYIDLIFADIKCVSPALHLSGTGRDNALILKNIEKLSAAGANLILRTPVVPTFNADDNEIMNIAQFIKSLPRAHPVELLAYHSMCRPKYAALGRAFPMDNTPEPTQAEMQHFTALFLDKGIDAKYSM